MGYKIKYTDRAIEDEREIVGYIISAYRDYVNAVKVRDYIEKSIDELKDYAKAYGVCLMSPLYEEGIRSYCVGKYRVSYRIIESENTVEIIRITGAAQNIASIKLY